MAARLRPGDRTLWMGVFSISSCVGDRPALVSNRELRMMRCLKALLTAGLISLAATQAHALTFDFSFADLENGSGTVSGYISGLNNNATGPATSVVVTSADIPGSFPLTISTTGLNFNTFTVVNDVITNYEFNSYVPATGVSFSLLPTDDSLQIGSHDALNENVNDTTFTLVADTTVPEPGSLSILGIGLVSLIAVHSFFRRRRQTAAS